MSDPDGCVAALAVSLILLTGALLSAVIMTAVVLHLEGLGPHVLLDETRYLLGM